MFAPVGIVQVGVPDGAAAVDHHVVADIDAAVRHTGHVITHGTVKEDDIAEKVGMNRNSIMLCLKKYKDGGVENAIYDTPGRGRNPVITDDEKTWIIDVACRKPTEFGYAAET